MVVADAAHTSAFPTARWVQVLLWPPAITRAICEARQGGALLAGVAMRCSRLLAGRPPAHPRTLAIQAVAPFLHSGFGSFGPPSRHAYDTMESVEARYARAFDNGWVMHHSGRHSAAALVASLLLLRGSGIVPMCTRGGGHVARHPEGDPATPSVSG